MKVAGELFGSGQMHFFVLQSAETMKAAGLFSNLMEKRKGAIGKSKIPDCHVKGDDDIGKNLVDIILTNNGYEVINLGIKQDVGAIIAAQQEHQLTVPPERLLVKSTAFMKDIYRIQRSRYQRSCHSRRRSFNPRFVNKDGSEATTEK